MIFHKITLSIRIGFYLKIIFQKIINIFTSPGNKLANLIILENANIIQIWKLLYDTYYTLNWVSHFKKIFNRNAIIYLNIHAFKKNLFKKFKDRKYFILYLMSFKKKIRILHSRFFSFKNIYYSFK